MPLIVMPLSMPLDNATVNEMPLVMPLDNATVNDMPLIVMPLSSDAPDVD